MKISRSIFLIMALAFVLGLLGVFFYKKAPAPRPADTHSAAAQAPKSYWTCPMHPQIHSEHPGECPICHMKLVEIKNQQPPTKHAGDESRSDVSISDNQQELLGVQKTTVEKMDLSVPISVAGRFISSSAVAFQIYEKDLRYIRPGLIFRGESAFKPEVELNGVVISVDSIVDPTSRTVRVVGSIKSGPSGILSETTFSGQVLISLKSVLAIPESSVLHTGQGELVYLFHEGGHLMPQNVKLGLKSESYYEVLDGLDEGDTISSGPNFLIDSEAKIRGVGTSGHSHN